MLYTRVGVHLTFLWLRWWSLIKTGVQLCMMGVFQLSLNNILGYKVVYIVHVHNFRSLAWAITIHKAQWLTLDKVVIDIGKKDILRLLHVHVCSDIMFNPPLVYQRVASLAKSMRLTEHKVEMLAFAQWNTPASLLHQHVMHDSTTLPVLQPVHSPSLSPHLHYQMNYTAYQTGWHLCWVYTSLYHSAAPLRGHTTGWLHIYASLTYPPYYLVLHLAPVRACCCLLHNYALSHPLKQGKRVTIKWLLDELSHQYRHHR